MPDVLHLIRGLAQDVHKFNKLKMSNLQFIILQLAYLNASLKFVGLEC
jgi:hypothetical protein